MDNHMLLLDLTTPDITGKDAEALLGKVGITVNKNAIPFDRRSPKITSGVRIGTPVLTSRDMGATEMILIGQLIARVFKSKGREADISQVRNQVEELCHAFPLYPT